MFDDKILSCYNSLKKHLAPSPSSPQQLQYRRYEMHEWLLGAVSIDPTSFVMPCRCGEQPYVSHQHTQKSRPLP